MSIRRDHGQAVIETLILIPVMMLIGSGFMILSTLLLSRIALNHLVYELALCPSVHTTEAQCRQSFVRTIEAGLPGARVKRLSTAYTPTSSSIRVDVQILFGIKLSKHIDMVRPHTISQAKS